MAELASFYGQDGTVGQVLRRTDRRRTDTRRELRQLLQTPCRSAIDTLDLNQCRFPEFDLA